MRLPHAAVFLGTLGLTFCVGTSSRAETTLCTALTAMPVTINKRGVYCLKADFTTKLVDGQIAVSIKADNVVLDLNGHTLENATTARAFGIEASSRRNVTVKNGTIRGFYFAVSLGIEADSTVDASQGHRVEGIHADRNLNGIAVAGRGNLVRGNLVTATGPDGWGSVGILVLGVGNRVVDNDVIGVAGEMGGGILFSASSPDEQDWGIALGNRVTDAVFGLSFLSANTKYRDNITTGVTYPYQGGVDAGNNN